MNIGVLGWDHEELETLSLCYAAIRAGAEPWLFTLDEIGFRTEHGTVEVTARGRPVQELDVVIVRAQLRYDRWKSDVELLSLVTNVGVPMLDPAPVFLDAESKLIGLQRMTEAGLPVPPTVLCRSVAEVREAWDRFDHRIVLKATIAFGGSGVERMQGGFEDGLPLIQRFMERDGAVMVEPFVPHPDGDYRATVVGDEVAFSYRRIPRDFRWKTNVAQGARAESVDPPPRVKEIALTAARAMGLSIAGADVIEHDGDYLIFEINNCPGWYPLQPAEQLSAADSIVAHAVRVAGGDAERGLRATGVSGDGRGR